MASTMTVNSLLTEREAAEFLRVCSRTAFNLREAGKLTCVKIGRTVRYRLEELQRFVRELEGISTAATANTPTPNAPTQCHSHGM